MTGKALVFQKGTTYLVKNLALSLSLAILLISLFMAYMFRSFRMIIVSLIPNLLPLVVTAGLMGYLGVPIKPSTILVFSIAFGISVDDTIHFLAKYRQELQANNWKIKKSVYAALTRNRSKYVLYFYCFILWFSVFTISSFGGTVALGALVSVTLLFAMLSNLLLLPSLLLSLERSIANKEVLKEPSINIIPEEDDEQRDLNNETIKTFICIKINKNDINNSCTIIKKTNLQEVEIKGWVRTFRANRFIALNDGSTLIIFNVLSILKIQTKHY